MPVVLSYLLYAVFPVGMALAALSDLVTMTIPNRLNVVMAAAWCIVVPFTAPDLATLGLHLGASALALAISFTLFSFGWIGGGDAKLAAVVALWFGWTAESIAFVAYASVFGGVLTLLLLRFRAAVMPGFGAMPTWVKRLHDRKAGVPYGIALAAGALAVYPQTVWSSLLAG